MRDNSFENKFRIELKKENLSDDNIEFIMSLISEDKSDENLKIMNNDVFRKLREAGLEDAFNRCCNRIGVHWNHSNEPSR